MYVPMGRGSFLAAFFHYSGHRTECIRSVTKIDGSSLDSPQQQEQAEESPGSDLGDGWS